MLLAYIALFSVVAIVFLGGMLFMGGKWGAIIGLILIIVTVIIELAKKKDYDPL